MTVSRLAFREWKRARERLLFLFFARQFPCLPPSSPFSFFVSDGFFVRGAPSIESGSAHFFFFPPPPPLMPDEGPFHDQNKNKGSKGRGRLYAYGFLIIMHPLSFLYSAQRSGNRGLSSLAKTNQCQPGICSTGAHRGGL